MNVIEVNHLSKDYGNGKGIFDITFAVEKGQVLGFLGPNGSGKTTTIRQLMGFMQPNTGDARIMGLHCFRKAAEIKKLVGYLPGEPGLIDCMKGIDFIRYYAKMKKVKDFTRAEELIELFQLEADVKIRTMSKGNRQKVGLVCAFLSQPEIVILDEPTSGLDPLMKSRFIDLILSEKEKGTTILLSSHIFEEVERTCDKTAILRDGCIAALENMDVIRQKRKTEFTIQFMTPMMARNFVDAIQGGTQDRDTVTVKVPGDIDRFIKVLASYPVKDMKMRNQSLEELFMHYYGGEY